MNVVIVLLIIAAAGMVLFSLARGLYHFSRVRDEINTSGPSEAHLAQNRMMFARVKWQAITILLLVILGFVVGSR